MAGSTTPNASCTKVGRNAPHNLSGVNGCRSWVNPHADPVRRGFDASTSTMTHTIHKFPVDLTDEFSLSLPEGAQILDVQTQGPTAQMWVLLDPFQPYVNCTFRVIGTGHPIDDAEFLFFIGTFQLYGGLVFHLFQKREP